MDWQFVQISRAMGPDGAALSLDPAALAAIFLGTPHLETAPPLHPACPRAGAAYWQREYLAAGPIYNAIAQGGLTLPHPSDASDLCTAAASRLLPAIASHSVFPLVYRLEGRTGAFFAVVGGITGRIRQVILPAQKLVIHELSAGPAHALVAHLDETGWLQEFLPMTGPVIGYVEMVLNHGHHMLNHLSALQRLVDRGQTAAVDEVWTAGRTFFGNPADLFPEIAGRHRHFAKRDDLLAALRETTARRFPLGSAYFNQGLRDRILGRAGAMGRRPSRDAPLISVTLRLGGRRCLNLHDLVIAVADQALTRWPRVKLLIDGYACAHWPGAAGSALRNLALEPARKAIEEELDEAAALAARLPAGVLQRTLNGLPMLDSVALGRDVDAYLAHVGTLQHKIGFLSDAVGMIHGPTTLLAEQEAGAFMHGGPHAPVTFPLDLIEDIPDSGGDRGPAHDDYRITDPARAAAVFCDFVAAHWQPPG